MFAIEFPSLSDDALIELSNQKLKTDLQEWEKSIWHFVSNWFNPSITSIKILTSGSTGVPKTIEHSKRAMFNSAKMTCDTLNLQNGDNALLCLPVNKIAGMMMIVRSIYAKMNLYCIQPTATPIQDVPEGIKISFAAFTPMQLHSAVKNYVHFRKAEQIDKIILGGENIGAEVLQVVTRFSNIVYHTFGMTETISHIALKKMNGLNPDAHYKVLDGISISTDGRNCLIIDAPELGQPHLVTYDVVQLISAKEFEWLGRTDNVINTGGVKIHPEELEQQLQANVQPAFFITSIPNERTGEKLVLAIEMNTLSEKDKSELTEALSKFDKVNRPKSVLLFHQFTRTENGKIKRKETLLNNYNEVEI